MAEATRLTRLGKLAEATAILRRFLSGAQAADRKTPPTTIDGERASADAGAPPGQAGAAFARPHSSRPRAGLHETVNQLAKIAKAFGRNKTAPRQPSAMPLPDDAPFTATAYTNAAGTRAYKLYVPRLRINKPAPLIVMLHGCTQSADDFAAGTRMNALAEEYGFLVAYPEQPATANAMHCWNWFKPDDQRRDEGEPSLIAGITKQIMGSHRVDPARVFIAGLSAGGAAAAIMGETYPDLYAGVCIHSGLPYAAASDLPSALDAMRTGTSVRRRSNGAVPTIIFHGDEDPIVHRRNGEAAAAQVTGSATGLRQITEEGHAPDGHTYSRVMYKDSRDVTVCEYWRIHRAGHAWAGGSSSGSYTDPMGPDASREMVRFFLERK
jgi:poly(hydroxyalkanoate) depolymerase family esterase